MYVPLNLSVQEQHPVPAGRYDLVITSAEETKSREKQNPQLDISIVIEGHDDAPAVRHFVSFPVAGEDVKKSEFKALLLKRFLVLFKIPHTNEGFDLDDLIGARASAELTIDTPEGKTESYNRLQVPKLRDEEHVSTSAGASRKAPKR